MLVAGRCPVLHGSCILVQRPSLWNYWDTQRLKSGISEVPQVEKAQLEWMRSKSSHIQLSKLSKCNHKHGKALLFKVAQT